MTGNTTRTQIYLIIILNKEIKQVFRQAQAVIKEIKQTVQARINPLSRVHNPRRTDITLMETWFSRTG